MDGEQVVFICTGNAARSVMAGAALRAHLPHWEVSTSGTLVVEGQPMSERTRAALEAEGLAAPLHRSRQARQDDLESAALVVALAPEHVQWVRRNHPTIAARTGTLRRLASELDRDDAPLAERVARLGLDQVELQHWEEIVDPGGGNTEQFKACAREVSSLVTKLAERLDTERAPFPLDL